VRHSGIPGRAVEAQVFVGLQTIGPHVAADQVGDDVQRPEAEGDAVRDQEREAKHSETEAYLERDRCEARESAGNRDAGYAGEVVPEPRQTAHGEGHRESCPKHEAGQDGGPSPGILGGRAELRRHLGDREAQVLVVDPLLAHDHHEGARAGVQRNQKDRPKGKRLHPGPPRDRLTRGDALKELADRHGLAAGVEGRHPGRQVRPERGRPVVVTRSKVVRRGDVRDEVPDQPHGGDR